MIELINVSKYYITDFGKHYVFRNVSLRLPPDINVAVIGPNGAGKSTFLRLLGGSDVPSEGRILKTGRISPPVGLTPGLQQSMTGSENTRFAGRIYGMGREAINENIKKVQELSQIGKFFDMPVRTYSAGMRQRLAFAISMSMDYDYYLFDEVGAGGDASFRQNAKKMVDERLAKSRFIIASHRLEDMVGMCQAGILIKDGELTYFDDIRDALAAYKLDLPDDVEEKAPKPGRKQRQASAAPEVSGGEDPSGESDAAAARPMTLSPEEKAALRLERRRQNRALKAAAKLAADTPKPAAAPPPVTMPVPEIAAPPPPAIRKPLDELRALLAKPLPGVVVTAPPPPGTLPVVKRIPPAQLAAVAPPAESPAPVAPDVAEEEPPKPNTPLTAPGRASLTQAIAASKYARAMRMLLRVLDVDSAGKDAVASTAEFNKMAASAQAQAADAAALARGAVEALTPVELEPKIRRRRVARAAAKSETEAAPATPHDRRKRQLRRRQRRRQRRQDQLAATS